MLLTNWFYFCFVIVGLIVGLTINNAILIVLKIDIGLLK